MWMSKSGLFSYWRIGILQRADVWNYTALDIGANGWWA